MPYLGESSNGLKKSWKPEILDGPLSPDPLPHKSTLMAQKENPLAKDSQEELERKQQVLSTFRSILMGAMIVVALALLYVFFVQGTSNIAIPILALALGFMSLANSLFGRQLKALENELAKRTS